VTVSDLPALNAALNGTATLLLLAGFAFIKTERKIAHRNCMLAAFGVSVVFLVTYVTHKILVQGVHTPFGGEGMIRTLYYVMLTSHILLAMAIVPLVLVTITHAIKARYEKHRAWARWTYPIWLYVSVTGVLVYFMLYQWFPAVA
jgi:putative membrane protein